MSLTTAPLADPSVWHALDPHDVRTFRVWGAGPDVPVPRLRLEERFRRHARARPDAVAVHDLTGAGRTTYATLDARVTRIARLLRRHGVGPGARVGVFARRGTAMAAAVLGVLRAGAAWVPQDARITPATTLDTVARDAGLHVVLTVAEVAARVRAAVPPGTTVIDLDEPGVLSSSPSDAANDHGPDPLDPDAPAVVIYTSGTTGTPNGVVVTHANLRNVLWQRPSNLGIGPGVRVAHLLNVAFDMAVWEVLGTLTQGGTLVVRGDDIQAAAARAHVLVATPSVLDAIDPARCPDVRRVAVAGERCPAELAARWTARGVEFLNACGPTEVSVVNTVSRVAPGADVPLVGRPLPRTTVYLLDPDLQPVPVGDVGEMWVGGDAVTAGYLHRPDLTAARYRPDPFWAHMGLSTITDAPPRMFRTRDLARWTARGELEIHGRTDDQVKVRGFRVELDAVAAALESVPGVVRAVAWRLDDRHLAAAVHPAGVDHDVLEAAAARHLPYYARPARIVDADHLPVTARGKVDRRALDALLTAPEATR